MQTLNPLHESYGAQYYDAASAKIITAHPHDLYYYTTYIGRHTIDVARGDSVYYLADDQAHVFVARGPTSIVSQHVATVIRGYVSDAKSCEITLATHLPYINGCSSKQLFAPTRPGDPTWQMLHLPRYTSEQAHHIHPTVRVVYVLKGHGLSVVGMKDHHHVQELKPGTVAIFERMCPHHFVTEDAELTVLPLHIFSSIGAIEHNHPMYHGTFRIGE